METTGSENITQESRNGALRRTSGVMRWEPCIVKVSKCQINLPIDEERKEDRFPPLVYLVVAAATNSR